MSAHPDRSWPLLLVLLALVGMTVSCAEEERPTGEVGARSHLEIDVRTEALTAGSLRSLNGTYGAGCGGGRAGGSWSIEIDGGYTPDHAAVSVPKNNTACTLTLTELRTASGLYALSPSIVLATAYKATSSAVGSAPVVSYLNAKLSAVTFADDFTVSIILASDPSPTNTDVVVKEYGMVGFWGLDEASGMTAYDGHGTKNGTLTNMAESAHVAGKVGNGLYFTGDDYVSMGNVGGSVKTVAMWVLPYGRPQSNAMPSTVLSNSGWTSPENAFAFDGVKTTATSTTASVEYGGFNLSALVPPTATITGVLVSIRGSVLNTAYDIKAAVYNGSTWSSAVDTNMTASDTHKFAGDTTPLWGLSWTYAGLANFKLRLSASGTSSTASIDGIQVTVTSTVATSPTVVQLNGTARVEANSGSWAATGFTSPSVYVNCGLGTELKGTTWQHVAVTTSTAVTPSAVKLGGQTGYFTGMIDDVRMYDRVLTQSELCTLAANPCSGGGAYVHGLCWYVGSTSQSCNTVCSGRGGLGANVASLIGGESQGGSLDACQDVMTAVGQTGKRVIRALTSGTGKGCHIVNSTGDRYYSSDSNFDATYSASQEKLVCGCKS